MNIGPASDPWVAGFGVNAAGRVEMSSSSVAESFESLILRQILSSLRTTGLADPSVTESGWIAMADDAFASYLSKMGGMGLAKSVDSMLHQARLGKR
ncbi:MAG: hypothetical protein EB069_00215 [Actinobacteria bacterium]|nr:hypothetical protein [Actinomycetota bacterium]